MADTIRVLVADDQALLRGSFRVLVDATAGMDVVGEAGDGATAVRLCRDLRPDVVLMDVRMPVLDGIAATREICTDPVTAGVRVLVLTMFDLDEYVYAALRSGASGFLLKDASPADLVNGIRVVHGGEAVLAPTVTRRLIGHFAGLRRPGPEEPDPRLPAVRSAGTRPLGVQPFPAGEPGPREPRLVGLTRREQEVLVLVADGLSNAEIADRLVISLPTVKTHVGSLLAKLGARDRAQLVVIAYESGIAEPGMPT